MREIKFRLWDGHEKKFLYPKVYDFSFGFMYQQYTGLKAKGVEVYEDDIVKFTDSDGSIMIGKVTMIGYQWGLENEKEFSPFRHQFHHMNTEPHEVIGNIYENPGLVK